jgi:hypothetical protein
MVQHVARKKVRNAKRILLKKLHGKLPLGRMRS